jgi:hypothetical protein
VGDDAGIQIKKRFGVLQGCVPWFGLPRGSQLGSPLCHAGEGGRDKTGRPADHGVSGRRRLSAPHHHMREVTFKDGEAKTARIFSSVLQCPGMLGGACRGKPETLESKPQTRRSSQYSKNIIKFYYIICFKYIFNFLYIYNILNKMNNQN